MAAAADARKICVRTADYFNCRLMPHGGPVLLPVVLATLGLGSSLADDGCDYARVSGAAAELLAGSEMVPYVDCGMAAYRVPGFYPAENSWRVAYSDECREYGHLDLLEDTSWVAAEWLRFLGLVVGGTTAMFLWTSTCLILRPNYWRMAGLGTVIACLCQMCSFVWFYTKLCHTSTTNFEDFEAGREVEGHDSSGNELGSSCTLFFGSKCAITSCVMYGAASAAILLRPYPMPVPKLIAQEEQAAMMMTPTSQGGQGGTTQASTASGRRRAATIKKGSVGDRVLGQSKGELTSSLSTAQTSGRSLQWASDTNQPAAGHVAPGHAPYRGNERSAELSGSAFSALSSFA
ncbi:hypothetical protein ACHAWF_016551 [Thalassiosira exigua]